jgi:hypothetical protein
MAQKSETRRMHLKGERWKLDSGEEVIITWDLSNGFLRVLNENGKLTVIHEENLVQAL